MTRADYQHHLDGLGSWAEGMPPWEMLMAERQTLSEEDLADIRDTAENGKRPAMLTTLQLVDNLRQARSERDLALSERDATRYDTRQIARTLLQLTNLTPSEVRERWPEEAGWLLES